MTTQIKKLSRRNRVISARLRKIIQCDIPLYQRDKILAETCQVDIEFIKWLNENGWRDIFTIIRDRNGKSLASSYSRGDYTRFPWFDEKGKLRIKLATLDEIEKRIKNE